MRGQPEGRRRPRGEPDIAAVAGLIAEPARARMLMALMGGEALTATELALEAGVAASTASGHLARLGSAAVVTIARQGRHRYFRLVDAEIAALLERLMGIAMRVCFDHLAGAVATQLLEGLRRLELLVGQEPWTISPKGELVFHTLGVDVAGLARGRRPLARGCLDWSERRLHLGGALGAATLDRLFSLRRAKREPNGRVVTFTAARAASRRRC